MKMLVFYRSRECTNAIISSTKSKLENSDFTKGLDVEFVNLDKRNYKKVFLWTKELPQFVYIWYDEEKITDYIKETYPAIKVIHFDMENAIGKSYKSYYGYAKEYILADLIIENFKENFIKKTMYQVDDTYKIIKMNMDEMDVALSRYPAFETREEAKDYCVSAIKKDIDSLEYKIESYQNNIKNCKADLKKKKILLKKYDDIETEN